MKVKEEPPTKPDLVPTLGQAVLTIDTDWQSPIIDFIKNNKNYPKGKEHEKLAQRAGNYVVMSCSGTRPPPEHCADAYPKKTESNSSAKSTRGSAATLPEPLLLG